MDFEYIPLSFYNRVFQRYPETTEILSSCPAIGLMRAATDEGRIVVDDLHNFREFHLLDDRVSLETPHLRYKFHQLIGHMCRQIMEQLGYEVDRRGVNASRSTIFISGYVYRLCRTSERD